MVRLKDIARAAGVTSATASTALSGRGRVSADMRERIRKLAREMNYEPDSAALLLKKKNIIDVGFLIADRVPRSAGSRSIAPVTISAISWKFSRHRTVSRFR